MTTELERVETIIRDALAELAGLEPDQIAANLAAEGMLWCGPGARSKSCPIHHYLRERLEMHGLNEFGRSLRVSREEVLTFKSVPTPDRFVTVTVQVPDQVTWFIGRYDQGNYRHLEAR